MTNPLVDLTTAANLSAYLSASGISVPAEPFLDQIITAVSQQIQSWLSRVIPSQPQTQTFSGTGGWRISMPTTPITAVSGVSIDGQAVPASVDISNDGYAFTDTQIVLRGCYRFCRGAANVTIAYTGGYAVIPPDIEAACWEGCGAALTVMARGDPTVTSRRAGDTAESYGSTSPILFAAAAKMCLTPNVTAVLSQYRRVIPAP